ncbi:MAG: protein kinase, partial [Planctomycetes bacterium]|nr:protein kinase [Planctomycetota bacterium]
MKEEQLGPYTLKSHLGSGGMGEVYLAHDPRLDRDVALKVLKEEMLSDEGRRARFHREAKAAAGLNHPSITTIHEVGEADGKDFIAQELVDGK